MLFSWWYYSIFAVTNKKVTTSLILVFHWVLLLNAMLGLYANITFRAMISNAFVLVINKLHLEFRYMQIDDTMIRVVGDVC